MTDNKQAMGLTTTITLVDGVRIVVPASRRLITTYVLQEQEDWFEDEIRFLRRLLQPGQKVIDIGANYGVFTLSMARRTGPEGRVWAFEPASRTAAFLAESIKLNNFSQIVLEKSALSNVKGTAQLSINANSELNALVHGNTAAGETESVPLVTLDERKETYGWRDIDFMKIDAEGEEANILMGGKLFFATLSPLVQYEIKAGDDLHLELVQAFATLGYDSYRLVPGLNLLVPFDSGKPVDGYLLNLFCCKPDRARKLAEEGFLLEAVALQEGEAAAKEALARLCMEPKYGWRESLCKLPYGSDLSSHWQQAAHSGAVESALALYAISRDPTLPPALRFAALESSFTGFRELCDAQPKFLRLSSLARAARDYGARQIAAKVLGQLCNNIMQQRQLDFAEPFLAPGERFDALPTRNTVGNWLAAAVFEELEILQAFSSYFSPQSSLERLKIIRHFGFGSPQMQRRMDLLQALSISPSP